MSKTITEMAEVIDCLHATPKYADSGYPMVRVENVKNGFLDLNGCLLVSEEDCDHHNKNHVPERDDIIITRVGSFGMMALVDTNKKFCLGQNIAVISPKSHGKFLYYYLQSPYIQKYIFGNSGGSSYKSLSLERIRAIPLEIDNLDISAIEKLLYQIDKKASYNEKIIDELSSVANLFYGHWFIQFDFPDRNGHPYKTAGGEMTYDERIKRNIPKGWQVKRVADLVTVKTGQQYAGFGGKDGKYRFFSCSKEKQWCDEYAFDGKCLIISTHGEFRIEHIDGKFNAYTCNTILEPHDKNIFGYLFLVLQNYLPILRVRYQTEEHRYPRRYGRRMYLCS